MEQYHGWLELFYGIGAVILGVVLAWAVMRNRRRNRANDAVTQAATREAYENPNGYDPEKYRSKLGPNR